MKSYHKPFFVSKEFKSICCRLQGTGTLPATTPSPDTGGQPLTPINCDSPVPSGCETFFGSTANTNCNDFDGASYNINAYIPGMTCSEILSQCAVTLNGQGAGTFCDGGTFVDGSSDCNGGCLVQWDCYATGFCLSASVEISCPGYDSCNTTVQID